MMASTTGSSTTSSTPSPSVFMGDACYTAGNTNILAGVLAFLVALFL